MKAAALLCLLAVPAGAGEIRCRMDDGTALSFEIDGSVGSLPQDGNDPPRRAVTWVHYGAQGFAAEPFRIGPVRGFHAPDAAGGMMFAVDPDGQARLAEMNTGARRTGMCEGL